MVESPPFQTEIIEDKNHNYRWVCSCGSKGVSYCFRHTAEGLAEDHIKKRHTGKPMSSKDLRYHLREACKQIAEFRNKCDPDEKYVLVSPLEMLGEKSFSEETRWHEF